MLTGRRGARQALTLLTMLVTLGGGQATAAAESGGPMPLAPVTAPPGGHACARISGYIAGDPLSVDGNAVFDGYGVRYVPYGISIMGLQQGDALTPRIERAIDNQITAATTAWHANTLRLQVSPFLAERDPQHFWPALDREIQAITCHGAIAVLNDNPMFMSHEPAPTQIDRRFVSAMAYRYRDLHNVIIDVFNEPHLLVPSRLAPFSARWMWRMWRWGGVVNGLRYLGIQDLIDAVRRTGNRNLIWAEFPLWGYTSLDLLRKFPLQGTNIELEFHHPPLASRETWHRLLQSTGRPRVEGEESQYSAPGRPECDNSAPFGLPQVLRALVRNHDGLVAWTLEPNVLVESNLRYPVSDTIPWWFPDNVDALTHPNHIDEQYSCDQLGEGIGSLVMKILKANSAANNPYAPSRMGYQGPR